MSDARYRELSPITQEDVDRVKEKGEDMQHEIEACEPCRERDIAVMKIQEAVMWCVRGITK